MQQHDILFHAPLVDVAQSATSQTPASDTLVTHHSEPHSIASPFDDGTHGENGVAARSEAVDEDVKQEDQAGRQAHNGQENTVELLDQIAESVLELERCRRSSLVELQQVAVELAIAVAEKLTYEKIHSGDYAIEEQVAAMVRIFEPELPLVVRLHPEDLANLDRRIASAGSSLEERNALTFEADGAIARGDCRLDSSKFGLTSDTQTRIATIRQRLLAGIKDAQVERRTTEMGNRQLRRVPDRRETA